MEHSDSECRELALQKPIIYDYLKPQLNRETGVYKLILRCGCIRMMRDYPGDKKCDLCGHLAKQHLRSTKNPQLFCMVIVPKENSYVKIENEKAAKSLKLAEEILAEEILHE